MIPNIKSIINENRSVKVVAWYLYRLLKRNTCKCYGRNNMLCLMADSWS